MDWLTKMNSAIDYIENNLTGKIDFNVVAQKACCSSYNFQRMFSFITDITLAEYIRRRRLTQAALELQNTNIKIIDVGIKYGYDSSTSFARAFALLHGITPTAARQAGAKLKAYPKISFQISIKGDVGMDYRIETKEAFDVFGVETICSHIGAEGFIEPPELWEKCNENGEYDRLMANAGDVPSFVTKGFATKDVCKIHAVSGYRKTEENTFAYMMCAFASKNSNTEGFTTVRIPSQTYVIFPSEKFKWDDEFHETLATMHKRIFTEWFPTANYVYDDNGADFEVYGGTEEYGYIELWYPIVSK